MYNAGSLGKRGRVVEGSSLENCRRGNPFVSSNLTASAKHTEQEPHMLGLFFVSHRRESKSLSVLPTEVRMHKLQKPKMVL
jgi:hypothetical protein